MVTQSSLASPAGEGQWPWPGTMKDDGGVVSDGFEVQCGANPPL